jgi:glycerol kinase
MHYLLAIDQGTTNSRAIIFNQHGQVISQHEKVLTQFFPEDGWVEQDAEELFDYTVECCRMALKKANLNASEIAAIGITNQRETTILWDAETGKPIYHAIVWQDRRTSHLCRKLAQSPLHAYIRRTTGLLLDPYFSATKIMWLLDHVPDARQRAERGELLFGTVDTFLLWKLTNGKSHLTDATNASRTLLFNIETQSWDDHILASLQIPKAILPAVRDNISDFGKTEANFFGGPIAITGMAGDQQAATVGQACFHHGDVKATYGTGCFMLQNTGNQLVQSHNQLLSTIAYRIDNEVTYGLEGSIFSAGTTIKWLRDTLKLIESADETEQLAQAVTKTDGVYLVPAFTGLGAPYWAPEARGMILGLTRASDRRHIVRAALESVAYQSRDLLSAMLIDSKINLTTLRVDGGMAANKWLLQFLADILDLIVERPRCIETTALGAAYLAGLQVGIYSSLKQIEEMWQFSDRFTPNMQATEREDLYLGWKRAVQRVLS